MATPSAAAAPTSVSSTANSSSSAAAPTSVSSTAPTAAAKPASTVIKDDALTVSTTKREDTNFTDLNKFLEWEIGMIKCASSPEEAKAMGTEWYEILGKFIKPGRVIYDVFVLESPAIIHLLVYSEVAEESRLARVRAFISHPPSKELESTSGALKYWMPSTFVNAVSINMTAQEKMANFVATIQNAVDQCERVARVDMKNVAAEGRKIETNITAYLLDYSVIGFKALHSVYFQ